MPWFPTAPHIATHVLSIVIHQSELRLLKGMIPLYSPMIPELGRSEVVKLTQI